MPRCSAKKSQGRREARPAPAAARPGIDPLSLISAQASSFVACEYGPKKNSSAGVTRPCLKEKIEVARSHLGAFSGAAPWCKVWE